MLSGDTVAPPGVIGPPQPDAAHHRVGRRGEHLGRPAPASAPNIVLGALAGRAWPPGPGAARRRSRSTRPAASLVPPMSTASARSPVTAPDGTERLRGRVA